jgi:L-threonylcarbamoyladenylate synthase
VKKETGYIFKDIEKIIRKCGIGVFPTDTLYGVIGSALKVKAVERIYRLRRRELEKPMIVLISSISDLKFFDIILTPTQKKFLKEFWPGKISVILDCKKKKFKHLHRGTESIAFRLPDEDVLRELIRKTGPLVAPSANISGEKPAENTDGARKYFNDSVDFYVDAGKLKSKPSTLVKLENDGSFLVLRKGAVKLKK